MALMKDGEVRQIIARLVGSKHQDKIIIVKAIEGDDTRRYFFYKKKGSGKAAKIASKALRTAGKQAVKASPMGAVADLAVAAVTTSDGLAGLDSAFSDGVLKMGADTGDHVQNSNLMHAFKANEGVRAYGILDHTGQMSFGLWLGTPDQADSWRWFLTRMDEETVEEIGYHQSGGLYRGARVLFNSHEKEHQAY